MARNVLPCTFLAREICVTQISFLHRTTAVHGGNDTLKIFSSGTDAARITQKRCFGYVRNSQPKLYTDV